MATHVRTLTLLLPALWLHGLAWAQGPDEGSPFTDASLPIDALKAEPSRAFEIAMICLVAFMLAGVLTGVFLGLGKLGALQEELRAAAADRRRTLELLEAQVKALEAGPAGAAQGSRDDGDEERLRAETERRHLATLEELRALRGAVGELGASLGTAAEVRVPEARPTIDPGAALAAFAERIEAALDSTSRAQASAIGGLTSQIASQVAAREAERDAPAEASSRESSPALVMELIEAKLVGMGYGEVHLVTPLSDVDPGALVTPGTRAEVLVEARRAGTSYKGRVALDGGRIADVTLQPAHSIFP